jgi:hypothetical protein
MDLQRTVGICNGWRAQRESATDGGNVTAWGCYGMGGGAEMSRHGIELDVELFFFGTWVPVELARPY